MGPDRELESVSQAVKVRREDGTGVRHGRAGDVLREGGAASLNIAILRVEPYVRGTLGRAGLLSPRPAPRFFTRGDVGNR